jgi:hypothetical protein
LDIYNRYAQPDIYPDLDLQFEGSNAKLHTVKILFNDDINNADASYWIRKLVPGSAITTEFL